MYYDQTLASKVGALSTSISGKWHLCTLREIETNQANCIAWNDLFITEKINKNQNIQG